MVVALRQFLATLLCVRLGAPLRATYNANGNTTGSVGLGYAYNFENHLIQQAWLTILYDSQAVTGVALRIWQAEVPSVD